MKTRHILHTIREEKAKGYKQLNKTRRTLFKALKEYLKQKYNRKVSLIFSTDDPLSNILEEKNFYPSSVTVYDKHGCANTGTAVSMQLTAEGKIKISTDEAGNIYDSEEYLPYDDLLNLCYTIAEYEKLLPSACRELMENGDWQEHAQEMIAESFPEADNLIIEDFIHDYWENLQTDDYNLKNFEHYIKGL